MARVSAPAPTVMVSPERAVAVIESFPSPKDREETLMASFTARRLFPDPPLIVLALTTPLISKVSLPAPAVTEALLSTPPMVR